MSAEMLLKSLESTGISLFVDGTSLRFRAPKGAVSDELRQSIIERREDVIRHLTQPRPKALDVDSGNCSQCDMKDWVDETPQNGRIRTTCRKCGRFIGYRTVPGTTS